MFTNSDSWCHLDARDPTIESPTTKKERAALEGQSVWTSAGTSAILVVGIHILAAYYKIGLDLNCGTSVSFLANINNLTFV